MNNLRLEFFRSLFLYPFSWVWEGVYRIRRFCYNYGPLESKQFRIPVISVGNLTFGGSGKTPFTIWLAEFLLKKNKKPVILSRGYKGHFEHGVGVIRGEDSFRYNPQDYGDEAILVAKRLKNVPVIVGKKRAQNLQFYLSKVKPDVAILDDGYQHLKIYRELNIVLFDALLPLEKYKVAPRGYMREGMKALQDADVVVFGRVDQAGPTQVEVLKEKIKPYCPKSCVFTKMTYLPTGLFNSYANKIHNIEDIKGMRIIAAAALASPDSFFKMLRSLGAELVNEFSFPDHHYFTKQEIVELINQSNILNAVIVVSEKDMVKIRAVTSDINILYLGITVEFKENESLLLQKILGVFESV